MPATDKAAINFFLHLQINQKFVTIKLLYPMKKGIILLGFLAMFSANAQEVQHVCGNSAADQELFKTRLLENIAVAESGVAQERDVQYVPVFFHLVADASGSGRIREYRVLEQLCALNATYATVGIQFYLRPHPTLGLFDKTINNDGVYSTQSNTFLMSSKRHQNAINYYAVLNAESGGSGPGLTLAYYSPNNDWIVSRSNYINGQSTNSTIAHETGHFFSLWHPFKGWESTNGFGPSYPGWPIAPVLAPDGGTTERQNGTNCTTAADFICDTGPDYKFAFLQNDCAPYNGGAKDPLGTLVDPMENNIMSYFEGCTNYQFTVMQQTTMLADLNTNARNYLDNTFVPLSLSIDTPDDLLVAPASGSTTQFYNAVKLEWNNVATANYYLIEIDLLSTFASPNVKSFVTSSTSLLVTDLQANRNYHWRVKPFNNLVGCANWKNSSFKTSSVVTNTVEIEGLSTWVVSPNPVENDHAHLTVNAASDFEANVSIVDAAGKVIRSMQGVSFKEGTSSVELPIEGLVNGFYAVVMDNGKARDVRKLILAK